MAVTFHELDGVIIRKFSGEVDFADMMESWQRLLDTYPDLRNYRGILTSMLDAEMKKEDANLNVMVEFLKNHMDQLKDLKIAMVMNTPLVTNTIIVSQKVKSLQIKPFATIDAALRWIRE
jgi:hypothetical protein